ncbi:MAG TPA: hypothetical protein VK204_04260 [Nocardioidaceae bacterium]|nr:hypothetical protein [Nocardioidaceae bacterium]
MTPLSGNNRPPEEVELTARLREAATESPQPLTQEEVDEILGLTGHSQAR